MFQKKVNTNSKDLECNSILNHIVPELNYLYCSIYNYQS